MIRVSSVSCAFHLALCVLPSHRGESWLQLWGLDLTTVWSRPLPGLLFCGLGWRLEAAGRICGSLAFKWQSLKPRNPQGIKAVSVRASGSSWQVEISTERWRRWKVERIIVFKKEKLFYNLLQRPHGCSSTNVYNHCVLTGTNCPYICDNFKLKIWKTSFH